MTRAQHAAWVRPLELHHNVDTREFFVHVEFRTVTGALAKAVIPRGQIDDPRSAKRLLASLGADIPEEELEALKAALLAKGCDVIRSTTVMGWHEGEIYLLPDGPVGRRRTLRPMKLSEPDRCSRGKASAWKRGLNPACEASSYLTFAVAVGFSGCLLRPMRQDEGAVFHFVGESSTGKSLASLAAQSVIEKAGRDHMRSHDLTDRALEEEAAACNDSLFVLDEAGRVEGTPARRLQRMQGLAYKLCGGQGRRRSEKAVSDPALRNVQYCIFGLSSGEEPLDGNGIRKRNDGEQVRLIGVPVPLRDEGGIFDREASGERRAELARVVEETICQHYGFPIRRFVSKLIADKEAKASAAAYAERFVRKAVPVASPFAERFARKFSVVYAAAMLAVDFGLAPWTRKQAGRAIRTVYRRAWEMVRPPSSAADDLLEWLRTHADHKKRFPEVAKGEVVKPRALKSLFGIRRNVSGKAVIALLPDRLAQFVPASQVREVEASLKLRGYLLPGKESGRHVRQLRVRGLEPPRRDFLLFDAELVLGSQQDADDEHEAA